MLADTEQFEMRNRTRTLHHGRPLIVRGQRNRNRQPCLNVDVEVSALGGRVVYAAGVLVHGIEQRRFIAGANPVKDLILRGR